MSLVAVLDVLVTSVVIASGGDIKARTKTIKALQDRFGDVSERRGQRPASVARCDLQRRSRE